MTPRIRDNDNGEITAEVNLEIIRGWSYSTETERRVKMLMAREFAEGYGDGFAAGSSVEAAE